MEIVYELLVVLLGPLFVLVAIREYRKRDRFSAFVMLALGLFMVLISLLVWFGNTVEGLMVPLLGICPVVAGIHYYRDEHDGFKASVMLAFGFFLLALPLLVWIGDIFEGS